jgi:hypothetical protein
MPFLDDRFVSFFFWSARVRVRECVRVGSCITSCAVMLMLQMYVVSEKMMKILVID